MPALHILFATPAYPPFPGGGERYAASLAEHLIVRGHQVTVVTSSAVQEPDFWQGSKSSADGASDKSNPRIIRCPIQPMPGGHKGLLAWRKAMVLLSSLPGSQTNILLHMARRIPAIAGIDEAFSSVKRPVDVVHGFNISWENALAAGWRFASSQGLPFVVTPFAHLGSKTKDRVALNSTMDHQRRLMTGANALAVLTTVEAGGLRRYGAAPDDVAVIGAGLDPLPPTADKRLSLADVGLTRPFALFIGRACYDKGTIHAAQAVLSLRRQGVELSLVLIGQISEDFKHFFGKLTAEEKQHIKLLGIVDENVKHALLEETSMLVMPSRMDSFGLVFLEAWAHGKPVIGANAGGIPGVIDDGKNGLLVPFGDVSALSESIKLLVADQAYSRELGENGNRKLLANYTWEAVAEKVIDVYRDVVEQSRQAANTSN